MLLPTDPSEEYQALDGDAIKEAIDEFTRKQLQENHERNLAIISGVDLEEALHLLLLSFIVDEKEAQKAIRRLANNFSSRISAAYCFGLISSDEYHDLEIIRNIRNQFAHKRDKNFTDKDITDLCLKLLIPKTKPDLFADYNSSELYDAVGFILLEIIQSRTYDALSNRRKVPNEIDPEYWRDHFA